MDLLRFKSINVPRHLYEKIKTLAKNTSPPQTLTKTLEEVFSHYEDTAMSDSQVEELYKRTDELREASGSPFVGWEKHS